MKFFVVASIVFEAATQQTSGIWPSLLKFSVEHKIINSLLFSQTWFKTFLYHVYKIWISVLVDLLIFTYMWKKNQKYLTNVLNGLYD